jgi:HD-GYP domain-containing protein (c-di-GMP phosphodiesterase class II)
LVTDVYICINKKFIKYRNLGEQLSLAKYNLFLSNNVCSIFILKNDAEDFIKKIKEQKQEEINEIVDSVGEEHRELVENQIEVKEKIYDTFADEELDGEKVTQLQEMSKELIAGIAEEKIPQLILGKLRHKSNTLADHAVNVANLSVLFGMALGHGHQYVLESIYMGGLFHDYGKIRISADIIENPSDIRYSQAIQDHPIKGRAFLSKLPDVSDRVLVIVEQHHEQYNGNGFPKGLKEDDIYDLAQIISMANVFDNSLIENQNRNMSDKEKYLVAGKLFKYDRGKMFNPDYIHRVLDIINEVYLK